MKILLRIFSSFPIYDLIKLDQVCCHWKNVINEFFWRRLTCIDDKVIDYPHGDAVKNFIEISHRVKGVTEISVDVWKLSTRTMSDQNVQETVQKCLLDLLKKLKSDAIFPLSLVDFYLYKKYPYGLFQWDKLAPMAEVRVVIAEICRELKVDQFSVINAESLLCKTKSMYDPLTVCYKGMQLPLLFDANRITRLEIGCLYLSTTGDEMGGITAALNLISRLMHFPKLETVQLKQVKFEMRSHMILDVSSISAEFTFHPNYGRFSIDEFLLLLTTVGDNYSLSTCEKMMNYVKCWTQNNWIQKVRLYIKSDHFNELFSVFENIPLRVDSCDFTSVILPIIFPSLTTVLYLDVDPESESLGRLINSFQKHGVFNQLKEFNIVLNECDFGLGSDVDPDSSCSDGTYVDEANKAKQILHVLKGDIQNLTILNLDLSSDCDLCPGSMSTQIDVIGPLPHLLEFRHNGIVSFPFTTSLVQQAPNLRCLNVDCYPFEDERAGLQGIKRLLDALEGNFHLSSVQITVLEEEAPRRGDGRRLKGLIDKNKEEDIALVEAIKNQSNHLASLLPRLYSMFVNIQASWFRFHLRR